MRLIVAGFLLALIACTNEDQQSQPIWQRLAENEAELLAQIAAGKMDNPRPGSDDAKWTNCLAQLRQRGSHSSQLQRKECASWTHQGITSTLVAIYDKSNIVPVIESRLEQFPQASGHVLQLVGGTGGSPFSTSPSPPDYISNSDKRKGDIGEDAVSYFGPRDTPEFVMMQAGHTIASVAYWGTGFRTLNQPDEIEYAAKDVRMTNKFYSLLDGKEPIILAESLGNHVALPALGKKHLERANILSLVPVIDGLQHAFEMHDRRTEPELKGKNFTTFAIYTEADGEPKFAKRGMLAVGRHIRKFVAGRGLNFSGFEPKNACSRIVLGEQDYRTRIYLERTRILPDHVILLKSDHDVVRGAPDAITLITRRFLDCVSAAN